MSKKQFLIFLSLFVVGVGGFAVIQYSTILNRSKDEGSKIVSRAVSSSSSSSSPTTMDKGKINMTEIKPEAITKTGTFNTLDPLHYANGTVITKQIDNNVRIEFSSDFKTNPDGPDLYVWLVKKQDIKNIALGGLSSTEGDYLDLGAIQNKSGAQAYQVTKEEFQKYDYAVVIWCRAFGVQFSNALLN